MTGSSQRKGVVLVAQRRVPWSGMHQRPISRCLLPLTMPFWMNRTEGEERARLAGHAYAPSGLKMARTRVLDTRLFGSA